MRRQLRELRGLIWRASSKIVLIIQGTGPRYSCRCISHLHNIESGNNIPGGVRGVESVPALLGLSPAPQRLIYSVLADNHRPSYFKLLRGIVTCGV